MRFAIPCLLLVAFTQPLVADDAKSLRTAFQMHCVKCHGEGRKVEGKVNLKSFKTDRGLLTRPALLKRLIGVLRDREMPPENEPALAPAKRKHMVARLEAMLRQAARTMAFVPTPMHRMNRFQYNNAVVDVLGLERDIFRLNERILRRRSNYFQPHTGKMPRVVQVSSRPLAKDIDGQRPEGFRQVAAFPQDKRAEHGFDNRADHLTLSPILLESFLQLSQSIAESPDLNARECGRWDELFSLPGKPVRTSFAGRYEAEKGGPLKVVGKPKGRVLAQNMTAFGKSWSRNHQLFWLCRKQGLELTLSFKVNDAGTGLQFGMTKAPDFGDFEIFLDGKKITRIDLFDPKVIHVQHKVPNVAIKTGQHKLLVKCVGKRDKSKNHFFGMDYLEVTGRKPKSKPKIVLKPEDAIRPRLKRFMRRAFRRPPDDETLDRFTRFAKARLAAGASFEETMRTMVGAVLGMPEFIYFYETGETKTANGKRQRIDDFELASRLSRFFWSSIPDDTLLDLAEAGKLSEPTTLSAQIDRMMNDQRASRFCDNFPAQWLQIDRLVTSIPDKKKYPYFYYFGYRTSMHMIAEPLLLFETVFIENRTIMDLIDPKFTYESNMLRANYAGHSKGAHQVLVQVYNRTPLKDPRRGGVITNAAIMTMTSTPTRTQPITRGAWINSVIFNDPPEPPPADVPPLPEVDNAKLAKLTIRERLAVHRKRADCAGCHNKIDPLGFAMENYGPTGVWRDMYENGRKVDVSGVLFNQHKFKSLVEFKRLLVKEKKRFIRGFAAHLMSYALGRELGPADGPSLDEITSRALTGNDQLRTIMKMIAMSKPFLHKNTKMRGNVPAK